MHWRDIKTPTAEEAYLGVKADTNSFTRGEVRPRFPITNMCPASSLMSETSIILANLPWSKSTAFLDE